MGNLYLFLLRLAREVDQMMKPEMTSSTASRVVTMIEREPLTAAMLTRTTKRTLHRGSLQNCIMVCLLGLGHAQAQQAAYPSPSLLRMLELPSKAQQHADRPAVHGEEGSHV